MRLSPRAQRVLGALIEKALATPQQYPLSLNALRNATNQSTGRDPVVDYDETQVEEGLRDLREQQLVRTLFARGSRTPKYEHLLDEALSIGAPELATLALLVLRGPQTVGEIRTRSDRLHPFGSLEEVDATLERLASHHLGPFVERLPRQPGQKEPRYRHLLGDDVDGAEARSAATDGGTSEVEQLRAEVAALRAEVGALRDEIAVLRAATPPTPPPARPD
ncbi:MAG: YceH family protein [Actinobacteria bacterium]|nr:YceH family protein [Actinomycetota bacterium]